MFNAIVSLIVEHLEISMHLSVI